MHEGTVTSRELAVRLGYSEQMLSHLVKVGAVERPRAAKGPGGRWRHEWPRDYVERLLASPPPAITRRRRRGS